MAENRTNPTALEVARKYAASRGLPFDPQPSRLALDPELAKRVSHIYSRLPHSPEHPAVRSAYDALKREVQDQYQHLLASGVRVEPWRKEGQPYATSADMRRDVADNNHLWYFPTGAEMRADHPMHDRAGNGLMYNDMFRAVHDYFGHAVHGHKFGPKGEVRAWHEHARMFSPAARPALTMETHGQNSWVNFAPGHQQMKPPDRPYAEQKANILPARLHPARLARRKDLIPGGKGDRLQPKDVDRHQLKLGIRVEHEHTRDARLAMEIALDHLAEDPHYYTKLRKAKLARKLPAQGWMAPDGTFHEIPLREMHRHVAERLAGPKARQEGLNPREVIEAAGYAHVGFSPDRRTLHGYHPSGQFTPEQVRALRELATDRGMAELTLDGGGKSRPVRLARVPKKLRVENPSDLAAHAAGVMDAPFDTTAWHSFLDHLMETHPDDPIIEPLRQHVMEGVDVGPLGKYLRPTPHAGFGEAWNVPETRGSVEIRPYRHSAAYRFTPEQRQLVSFRRMPGEAEWTPGRVLAGGTRYSDRTKKVPSSTVAQYLYRVGGLHNLVHAMLGTRHFAPERQEERRNKGGAYKFARERTDGPAAALATSYSVNAEKRLEIARRILKEAGLAPAVVRTVLAHEPGRGVRATVLQAITKRVDPATARYVAAWWGLLSREKKVTVFHPGEGDDVMHVLHSPLPVNATGELLSRAGIPSYSVEEAGDHSRAYVYSPGRKYDLNVKRAAGALNARHTEFPGSGFSVGVDKGSNSDARANYRSVIRRYEAAATGTPAPTRPTSGPRVHPPRLTP